MDTFKERTIQNKIWNVTQSSSTIDDNHFKSIVHHQVKCVSLSLLCAMYLNNNSQQTNFKIKQITFSHWLILTPSVPVQLPIASYSKWSAVSLCVVPLIQPTFDCYYYYIYYSGLHRINIPIKLKFPQEFIKYPFIYFLFQSKSEMRINGKNKKNDHAVISCLCQTSFLCISNQQCYYVDQALLLIIPTVCKTLKLAICYWCYIYVVMTKMCNLKSDFKGLCNTAWQHLENRAPGGESIIITLHSNLILAACIHSYLRLFRKMTALIVCSNGFK